MLLANHLVFKRLIVKYLRTFSKQMLRQIIYYHINIPIEYLYSYRVFTSVSQSYTNTDVILFMLFFTLHTIKLLLNFS